MAKRFVEHFVTYSEYEPLQDKINTYAEANDLTIITITAMGYEMYVLFEEKEGD